MDLRYGFRQYLAVPTLIFIGAVEGIRRALDDTSTTQATGGLLLLAAGAAAVLTVRWLLKPVDAEALERRDADREALGLRRRRERRWSNPFDYVPRQGDKSS